MAVSFDAAFKECPLVAVLRGLTPREAVEIGAALVDAGFRIMEVPLNSPQPFDSIRLLQDTFGDDALIGAGTVLSAAQVEQVARAGGRLIVSPHFDADVVRMSVAQGLTPLPGAATPTEVFAAQAAGANAIKLFPAEMITPQAVRALRAVVPRTLKLLAVGGITPELIPAYMEAGADGFGTGSALYAPGRDAHAVGERARAFVAAVRSST